MTFGIASTVLIIQTWPKSASTRDATPIELFDGVDGSKAAFVLASTMPGVPLLYNGQELGVQDTISFFARTPYDWDRPDENTLVPFYTKYLRLYRSSPALRRGALTMLTPNAEDALLYTRSFGDEVMLIAVNVRDEPVRTTLPEAYPPRDWVDAFSGTPADPDTLQLGPYDYRLFRVAE